MLWNWPRMFGYNISENGITLIFQLRIILYDFFKYNIVYFLLLWLFKCYTFWITTQALFRLTWWTRTTHGLVRFYFHLWARWRVEPDNVNFLILGPYFYSTCFPGLFNVPHKKESNFNLHYFFCFTLFWFNVPLDEDYGILRAFLDQSIKKTLVTSLFSLDWGRGRTDGSLASKFVPTDLDYIFPVIYRLDLLRIRKK